MEEKIYQILKKHKLPLKKREQLIVDLLSLFNVRHCFSGVTEEPDSIEDLVLDYNVSKWLHDNGYYDDKFKLIASKGTPPIFRAIKEAKKQEDSEENKILRNILLLRIK